jgi:pyrroline-5-carboxylate reductase
MNLIKIYIGGVLMYKKVGFIGSGNMAGAIIGGLVKSGFLSCENIFISDKNNDKTKKLKDDLRVDIAESNLDIIEKCDVVILSVKPNIYETVLNEIKQSPNIKSKLIVTIAAGITIDYVKGFFDSDIKVIRTMPNTPALVGEGMTGITYKSPVTQKDVEFVKEMFSSFGLVEVMDEKQIDAVSSLCGSSPAYVSMFIEAMADAGVLLGLPREASYKMAAQSVKGTAEMIIKTGKHPAQIKDMVSSPGGTTIEGVRVLEDKAMRSAVIEAVIAAAEKAKDMGKK